MRARARAPATDASSSPSDDTHVGVLPIGYGDGWRRGLSNNADVLIGGQRYPLVGTVSMDSITVDLGADAERRAAARRARDPDRLRRASERITAEEVARRLETINYEITCGSRRACRAYTTATACRSAGGGARARRRAGPAGAASTT